MISFELFLFGLLFTSVLSGLATEGVKKILTEHKVKYSANTLAGIVATISSILVGVCYIAFTGIGFTSQVGVALFALIVFSWICSMVGYDKVIQTFSQLKFPTKED